MRSHIRTAAVVLSLGLVVAACSDAEEAPADAAPTSEGQQPTAESTDAEDHGAHDSHGSTDHDAAAAAAATGPVGASVLGTSTGSFGPLGEGLGSATNTLVVEGTVTLVKDESGTEITTNVGGLLSGADHAAHLHDGSCTEFGGHYMHDHAGPPEPPNEIWLSSTGDPVGSLQPSQAGTAVGAGGADWVPRETPLSMMIHDSELPGLPIACADFAAYDGPATLVLEPTDDGIDAIEYSLDGGEWTAYEAPVEITEPGEHTVAYAPAGEHDDAPEITFTVAGAR
ncbi:hypothetical protein SAMN05216184_11241 [Georgenia satyanarayanai]|uniref:Superoxide dismutase, Cu-Zn family n=1 Tax=Georgenia satyanarayanai TaxID=860221 RepID=A0A2Y9BZY3_9MICO|nr:hypothetical protein [Georgenia satyanarayanai]PYF98297.1 hypothetical protein A8987_11241 [Georgenia satyanarayanai]SSA45182.1 hypothetical protein SAMN05216184_11241 [Georgenia satyanarayanai]